MVRLHQEKLISEAKDYDSFYDIFDNLEKQQVGKFVEATIFKIKDMYIYLEFDKDADYYKNLFTKLNDANISLAPQYLKSINSKSGFSATITKIAGTDTENLRNFYKSYDTLTKQNKESAYTDIQKLLKLGLMNNKVLSRNAFEVTANGRIVIPNWDGVAHISTNQDKMNVLNVARETLFQK